MNQLTQALSFLDDSRSPAIKRQSSAALQARRLHKLELAALGTLLLAFNWTLFQGASNTRLMFMPEAAMHGEWWRWFTHPFIHVTWWHLLLDGAAFLMLYRDFQDQRWMQRILYCVGSAAGSLIVCFCADLMLPARGLCGISGIAHGLMAISALNLIQQRHDKVLFRMGLCSFALVTVKCVLEALTGKMFFTFLYFGMVGDPIAVTHAGGLLGALVIWSIHRPRNGSSNDRPG